MFRPMYPCPQPCLIILPICSKAAETSMRVRRFQYFLKTESNHLALIAFVDLVRLANKIFGAMFDHSIVYSLDIVYMAVC
jgi:hypothetical protein